MSALVVAAVLAAFVAGFGAGKVKWRRGPINVVRGILLPHPSDERWERRDALWCYHATALKIGEVEVCGEHGVHVARHKVAFAGDYKRAVIRAQVERKALKAALDD